MKSVLILLLFFPLLVSAQSLADLHAQLIGVWELDATESAKATRDANLGDDLVQHVSAFAGTAFIFKEGGFVTMKQGLQETNELYVLAADKEGRPFLWISGGGSGDYMKHECSIDAGFLRLNALMKTRDLNEKSALGILIMKKKK